MDSPPAAPPLGKYLASSDKKIRDKAIKNLSKFLSDSTREPLSTPELDKLWKGLFYCYWMSDKPLVQQALSSELAELVLTISTTSAALSFLRAFWVATVREWSGIDRLRLDKYYMLIRKFTNAAFRLLIRTDWQEDACSEYNAILSTPGGPLCPDDNRIPSSLGYHLADIYLEELNKSVEISPSCPPVPLYTILSPFLGLAARTPSKTTFQRLQTSLFSPLFLDLSCTSESPEEASFDGSNEPERNPTRLSDPSFPYLISNARADLSQRDACAPEELIKLMYQKIFDVASQEDTRDANRRRLYAMWKEGLEDTASEGLDIDAM